jgi:hypothetical protein
MLGRRLFITGLVVAGAALAGAAPVAAQGKGKGLSKGRVTTPQAAAASSSPATPLFGIRQFGSWLDDASLAEPGGGWASVSLGLVRSSGGRQMDFPVGDVGFGLSPRIQVGLTIPYYRLNFSDGSQAAGVGDIYFAGKIGLIDPAQSKNGFGAAFTPVVEILNDPDELGGRAYHVGLPLSVEWRQPKYRVYGSSGWFSRGAFFGSGAVEVPLSNRVVVTGVLSHTRALNDDPNADALGLSKARTDASGGAAFILTPSIALYGSVGRTISAQDANAASFMMSGGMSVSFTRKATRQ